MTVDVHDLADGRRLRIALPEGYDRSTSRYPTVFVLDERWSFGTMVDTITMMSMAREIPKCLVVGLGYQDQSLAEVSERRAGDFTPTEADFPDLTRVAGRYGSGGGAALRDLLIDEIVPFVDDRHRTIADPDARVLFGHSFSGLCGLYCFLTRSGTFGSYLLASPSIWWDDRILESMALPNADSNPAAVDARLFITAGANEVQEPSVVLANARRFAARLDTAGFDVRFHACEGESHFSTIGPAISLGLRHLLGSDRGPAGS